MNRSKLLFCPSTLLMGMKIRAAKADSHISGLNNSSIFMGEKNKGGF